MQSFTTLTSHLIPLPNENVDTDQIIPARYLKVTDKAGLAEGLFSAWRYQADGTLVAEFPLNRAEYHGASILLAGDNFGCGSSREHAPWALMGWGIRAVISTSFADIFNNNALKNGLLPVNVSKTFHRELFGLVDAQPKTLATIDLARQIVQIEGGQQASFPIDEFNKICLLEGLDQLGYLLRYEQQISAFEHGRLL
jgi:3-isopropylmalate/(R)-2-methylmalate dehydratase small subunit